jgi:hypothetical protein
LYKTSYSGGVNTFGSPTYTAAVNLVAGQWYDFKVIYDRITGKMDVYKDNSLIATWTDPSPLASGTHVSFRSGNCKWSLDEIKVYRSRPTASVTVLVGPGNTNDIRYQNPNPTQFAAKVKSIVNDVAGNVSSIFYHDLNIDWTNPSNITTVNDGKVADINVVVTSDSLSANWSSSNDPNSAIEQYWYSIGTSPGAVNTLTWTSNWTNTIAVAKNLALTTGTTYYFNVKSENGAGLFSNVISSDGQTVTIPTSVKELTESNFVTIYPNPFNNSFVVSLNLEQDYEISMTLVDATGREIITYQSKESSGTYAKTIDANSLNLSNGIYWVKIKYNNQELCKKLVKQ